MDQHRFHRRLSADLERLSCMIRLPFFLQACGSTNIQAGRPCSRGAPARNRPTEQAPLASISSAPACVASSRLCSHTRARLEQRQGCSWCQFCVSIAFSQARPCILRCNFAPAEQLATDAHHLPVLMPTLESMENPRTHAVWSAFFANLLKVATSQPDSALPLTAEAELTCTPGPAAEEQLAEIRAAGTWVARPGPLALHSSPGGTASAALWHRAGKHPGSAAAWQSGAIWQRPGALPTHLPSLWQSACFAEPRVLLDTFPSPVSVAPVRERKHQRSVSGRYCVAPRGALAPGAALGLSMATHSGGTG